MAQDFNDIKQMLLQKQQLDQNASGAPLFDDFSQATPGNIGALTRNSLVNQYANVPAGSAKPSDGEIKNLAGAGYDTAKEVLDKLAPEAVHKYNDYRQSQGDNVRLFGDSPVNRAQDEQNQDGIITFGQLQKLMNKKGQG